MPKKPQETQNNAKLKAAIKSLKAAGIDRFMLGFVNGELISTHLEAMPGSAISRVTISFFHQLIEHEIEANKDQPQYQEALRQMQADFAALIKNYNVRFDALRARILGPGAGN